MNAWETGARAPKPATQVRLAGALGLECEDLERPGPGNAEDLRHMREPLGWICEQAAQRLGVDPSALKRVEAAAQRPADPKSMARVYGLTAAELAVVARRTGG